MQPLPLKPLKRKVSFMFRYSSELRLVRLKMSEGGVYTFQASNGDASVNHTFTIFVTSKSSYGFLQKGVLFPPATSWLYSVSGEKVRLA